MVKIIYCKNFTKEEKTKLNKLIVGVKFMELPQNRFTIKHDKLNILINYLKYNDEVEANLKIAKMLNIHQRTLNRYVKELIKDKKIIGELSQFKNGGRGYVIQSAISKKRTRKKKVPDSGL